MERILIPIVFLMLPKLALAEKKSGENLSNVVGALSQLISDKTQISGVKDQKAKITPRAQVILNEVQNDLELCQTSKTNSPEVVKVEKDGVSLDFKKFDLKIYGDKCSIEMEAAINATQQSADQLQATFTLKVVMKSAAYIEKYKIKTIAVHGTISAKAEKTGTTVTLPVHIAMGSSGESTELGQISQNIIYDMKVEVNLAQFSFNVFAEQKANLQYGDVIKNGYSRTKMTGFTQPEAFYSLDDKEVSQSEFQIFLQSFILPGTISDDNPNAPDSKAPTSCQFVAYDAKAVTLDQLKTQMATATLQKDGQLLLGHSCMKDVNVPFDTSAAQLTYGDEWISLTIPKKSPNEQATGVYVLYGDQAVQTREADGMILGLQCKVVAACQ